MIKCGFVEQYISKQMLKLGNTNVTSAPDSHYHAFTGADAGNQLFTPESTSPTPFVINIRNATTNTIVDFPLFGANSTLYQYKNFFNANGNFILTGVIVTAPVPNTSYRAMVVQSQTQPFTIGKTVITGIDNLAQIQQSITVTTTDASGKTQGEPMYILKDPYQNQSDMVVSDTPYAIDGTALLTVTILPLAEINVFFYPTNTLNPANLLVGVDQAVTLPTPKLIRVLPVEVK